MSIQARARGRVATYIAKKHEDFSCYMCFISRRPLTYRVIIKNINRKELYDFYYTAITLTTGYKSWLSNRSKVEIEAC